MTAPLPAHSVAEASLYLMATPCPSCGRGPLASREIIRPFRDSGPATVQIGAVCDACGAERGFRFTLPAMAPDESGSDPPPINERADASSILDVGQWLTLFRMFEARAGQAHSRSEGRRLAMQAAQCIEEALKFYDDQENDLPPPSAMFVESTRRHFAAAPEHYSRRRLIELRAKLPTRSSGRVR